MAVFNLFKLSMLLTLLSDVKLASWPRFPVQKEAVAVAGIPARCNTFECPTYNVIFSGDNYEIRLYNSSMWATTSPIDAISLTAGTANGFHQLYDYFYGKNNYRQQMNGTAPMLTEILPSDGKSSFLVSLYIPKINQRDPPPAAGITAKNWGPTFVVVRQFGGPLTNSIVDVEATALSASISDTIWADAVKKSHAGEITDEYTVAQYNSPYEIERVNEIWYKFYM